jgi:hypothetical protein
MEQRSTNKLAGSQLLTRDAKDNKVEALQKLHSAKIERESLSKRLIRPIVRGNALKRKELMRQCPQLELF